LDKGRIRIRSKTTHYRKGVKKYRESVFYYDWQYYCEWQYRAIHNMKSKTTNILRGANRYRVLEDSDEEGTYDKVQNVRFNNERE